MCRVRPPNCLTPADIECVPPEVFTQEYQPPRTDGSGQNREQLREAVRLFGEAGWRIDEKTRRLTESASGPSRRR